MTWAANFYSETGRWWGGAENAIGERDRARVASLRRLTAATTGTILDLGCSYGNTAAAFALAGYSVTGVEISDRIEYAQQHRELIDAGALTFVRADFNAFEAPHRFDVVTYWNGFGIGSDAEQRRLLTRIASDWLAPDGWVVVDVFNPVRWISWAGDTSHRDAAPDQGYPFSMSEYTDFDPVRSRFIDTWTLTGDRRQWTQSQRCYSPADLLLLLEPTGLELIRMEIDGKIVDPTEKADHTHPLWTRHEYRVALRNRVDA